MWIRRSSSSQTTRMIVMILPCFLLLFVSTYALSSNSYNNNGSIRKALGSASNPLQKQRVAVFGGGGYLGANVFGFLQRAGSIYGTGMHPPKVIGATKFSAQMLNQVLGNNFKLAFAGEDSIYLTDMSNIDAISSKLVRNNIDAVVIGTQYQLEERPVTANTYEGKNPNAKTLEFFLDQRKGGGRDDIDVNDTFTHVEMFRKTIDACYQAGVKHVVIIETPCTGDETLSECAKILSEYEKKKFLFTYIRALDDLSLPQSGYTYESGVFGALDIKITKSSSDTIDKDHSVLADQIYSSTKDVERKNESKTQIGTTREDLAAVVVQCLLSLDWTKNRIVEVSTKSTAIKVEIDVGKKKKNVRTDKEWCVRSDTIASNLERDN